MIKSGPLGDGSSPLTRGKLCECVGRRPCDGLIPAHAGKTAPYQPRFTSVRAHPRSRGENVNTVETMFHTVGSSPLTRGKRRHKQIR